MQRHDFNYKVPDLQEQEFELQLVHFHEDYNLELPLANDIALIKIKARANGRGIMFGDRVIPICLPPTNVVYSKDLACTVSGWGSTGLDRSNNGTFSRYLQSASLPYLETSKCIEDHVYGPRKGNGNLSCISYCRLIFIPKLYCVLLFV